MPETLTPRTFTGRVSITTPKQSDDIYVSILRSSPETRRYLSGVIPDQCSVEDARRLREKRDTDKQICDFTIHTMVGTRWTFAGMTGVFKMDDHRSCEVGILVSPELHGKGVATEALYLVLKFAFEEKGMHRVTAETRIDNSPMRSWFEKVAGATLEGRRRDAWMSNPGKWMDVVSYSILEDEWRDNVKASLEAKLSGMAVGSIYNVQPTH